jgi:tryptophanase
VLCTNISKLQYKKNLKVNKTEKNVWRVGGDALPLLLETVTRYA